MVSLLILYYYYFLNTGFVCYVRVCVQYKGRIATSYNSVTKDTQ